MNRLHAELRRLYLPDSAATGLMDGQGRVRAMVLELARPADWQALAGLWRGVQADLGLPAPAIAVSGAEGFQLWFALAEPLAGPQAQAFLEALCSRYLPEVTPSRLTLWPADGDAAAPAWVPAQQNSEARWSAFVAPDLAPIFADTPWLDIAPGDEGQADLLRGLSVMKPAAFEAALAQLTPAGQAPAPPSPVQAAPADGQGPRSFLRQVMNDNTVALALRIEAAKALLEAEGRHR
jgi:hypothetical protein